MRRELRQKAAGEVLRHLQNSIVRKGLDNEAITLIVMAGLSLLADILPFQADGDTIIDDINAELIKAELKLVRWPKH
jgi:hypothetical protein